MTGQEIATAVQYELSIVIIVINNAMLGTIRMHQEMRYPGRISHTDLSNPDFCALAAAHGLGSERVSTTDGFAPALQRALAASSSTLIELITDAEAIAHTTTLTELRARSSR
jgi:acetolactate synthase-1/2/3 large subunit